MERRFKILWLVCALMLVYCLGYSAAWVDRRSVRPIDNALQGLSAWLERRQMQSTPIVHGEMNSEELRYAPVTLWNRNRTQDGYTLITGAFGARAFLLDMKGVVVHQWELPFTQAFKDQTHVQHPVSDERISWFKARVLGNGDLMASYSTGDDTPSGYGLVRMDRHSKVIWKLADHAHHDFDTGADGAIYTLVQGIEKQPVPRLPSLRVPYIADYIVKLSPQGNELSRIALTDAFLNSDYAAFLEAPSQNDAKGDFTHANSLQLLTKELAAAFPQFKPGQILLSFRNIDAIAVVDFSEKRVVWAAKGIWRHQHSASFLPNGRILLFDNSGRYSDRPGSRLLEFDPKTLATPWIYNGTKAHPFNSRLGGMVQRLANGNVLAVSSMSGHLYEITPDQEVVWHFEARRQFNTLLPAEDNFILLTGMRYQAGDLPFLAQRRSDH